MNTGKPNDCKTGQRFLLSSVVLK